MRIFLTGASGFVGSHVLRHLLMNTDAEIVCPVTFRHKGTSARLREVLGSNVDYRMRTRIISGLDLTAPIDRVTEQRIGPVDYILNVASESHVDRSIVYPGSFISNNVALMTNLLDYARRVKPKMFLQMSTDEVYGPAYGSVLHREWESIRPSNPYSASKAAQEAICFSYWRTYGVPVVVTNTMNIIGQMQDPEKFLPKIIKSLRDDQPITMHVSPEGEPGSRFYLPAINLADAWLYLMEGHEPNVYPTMDQLSRFNIVGEAEVSNLSMINIVARIMNKTPKIEPVSFHSSRPGHDLRYALDGTKIRKIGWTAPYGFEESLVDIVQWTLDNPEWLA